jgi:phosphatidylserine/phosphatidylglycerophosphate/cardiolipin synthase-like enzyme
VPRSRYGADSGLEWGVGASFRAHDEGELPLPRAGQRGVPTFALLGVWPAVATGEHPALTSPRSALLEMINESLSSIDVAAPALGEAETVAPLVWAVRDAADRGVRVRVLVDGAPAQQPRAVASGGTALAQLAARRGIEVRRLPSAASPFLGSSNGDELGVLLRAPASVRAIEDVFELDWASAGGPAPATPVQPPQGGYRFPEQALATPELAADLETARLALTPLVSPASRLPGASLDAESTLVRVVETARESMSLRLPASRGQGLSTALGEALADAAARGVRIDVLVSSAADPEALESLRALGGESAVRVRVEPAPSARAAVALAVVDGRRSYAGSGGLDGVSLRRDRNLGLLIDGESIASVLQRFFTDAWTAASTHALRAPRD